MTLDEQRFTFRPPQQKRGLRLLLGILLSTLAIGGAGFGAGALLLPRTLSYEIRDHALIVHSGLKARPSTRKVSLGDLHDARAVELQRGKRKVGTSLPGYCAGRFNFPRLGTVDLVSNCSRQAVILEIKGAPRPLVMTPQDRTRFLSALGGEGIYTEVFHPGEESSRLWKIGRFAFFLVLLPVLVVPLIFFVSPSRLRYRILPQQLEIHLLIGVKRFGIGNCFAQFYRPQSAMKTIGASLPGYHAGRFRVDGMATRVYATGLKEGILIEGPDLRLLVTPEEPRTFLEALRSIAHIEIHEES